MAVDPFIRHLGAFTQALGYENAPTIFALSAVGWPDDDTRDEFILDISGVDLREAKNYG